MSDIHYFQRYSQKENVVTNNTLQLFAHVYRDRPQRLQDLLGGLIDAVELDMGLSIEQQTRGADSIPDGALTQQSFKLLLETKLNKSAYRHQLERHLDAFEGEDERILLLLSPHPVEDDLVSDMKAVVEEREGPITFATTTFADVVGVLKELVHPHEHVLRDLVSDYEAFCSGMGLIPPDDVLRAVPCGQSHKENARLGLYYAPSSRSYRPHQYVGIYYHRAIRHIGKLRHEVDLDLEDGQLVGEDIEKLSEGERQRVREAIKRGEEKRGWGVRAGHRFFIVDAFHETEFKKTSKYGMRGQQYFRLREELDLGDDTPLPSTEEIAARLKEKEWK
jgi:hypothetical protein